jgi:WhiB family redox-sensing transcriptional regulator
MTTVITDSSHAPWMAEGACRDHDPELFFPIGVGDVGRVRRATSICDRCGVEAECLRYALLNHVKHGIWGGRTEEERIAMTRTRERGRGRL